MLRCWIMAGAGAILILASSIGAQEGLRCDEQIYDFGHIGVDYQVYHDYKLHNPGSRPVRIDSMKVPCDCSTAQLSDSTVRPGDSVTVHVTFSTRDYYGPTSKSITLYTDGPGSPKIELFYLSNVGRWIAGLKPEPISLFFLPGHKAKKVTLTNTQFESYGLEPAGTADNLLTVSLAKSEVRKGQSSTFDVSVSDKVGAGTVNTCFRLKAVVPDIKDPVFLTIPVKIVRY
ncbi:MAG: DUF1573 domain-containing protein [Candidatus Zixiibacteriota bacterium]